MLPLSNRVSFRHLNIAIVKRVVIMFFKRKLAMPDPEDALKGRPSVIETSQIHYVNNRNMFGPYPAGTELAMFGAGCFWGVEKQYWNLKGVHVTAVGYSAGFTPNPTYREVCSGLTGHNEVVRVVFFPEQVSFQQLLRVFWECHDPTQGMRQGNDVGTQYRSGIYVYNDNQSRQAQASRSAYEGALRGGRFGPITTEIVDASEFYFAEAEHQQYLAKNPFGYCGLGGTGVCYVPATETVS